MKKILLPLVALMLSATVANAQVKQVENELKLSASTTKTAPNFGQIVKGAKAITPSSASKAMAPAKKKAITEDQRYLGNDNALSPYYAVGLPGVNATKAGAMISADLLKKYAGDRIVGMRFILATPVGATHCSLVEVNDYNQEVGNFEVSSELASADLAKTTAADSTSMNWNEVTFDKPYTIPSTPKDVIFGLTYKQKSTKGSDGNYTSDCYPFYTSQTGTAGGFCIYAPANNVTGWYPMSLNGTWVDLCAQVIIEREGGFIEDIELGAISAQKFVQRNNTYALAFSCRNTGSKSIKDYVFGLAFDGQEFGTLEPKQELTDAYVPFQVKDINVPEGTQDGAHVLSVYVKSMKGTTPTGDLSNDTLYSVLRVYTESIPHQKQLVEHFTGQACSACPYGYDVLNNLNASRKDIAWVAVHNYLRQEGDDDYVIDDSKYITSYCITGLPSAAFNRYLFANETLNPSYKVGLGIGYNDSDKSASKTFSQIVDLSNEANPAFARIDLTQSYDDGTGEVTITVRGTGVKNAAKILQGTRLTIYLTEDGLIGTQQYGSSTIQKYKHDHVLRYIVTNPGGDNITWNGDNFEMTYTQEISDDYDYTKMHAIAFINNPFIEFSSDGSRYGFYRDNEDVWVSNCNSIDISKNETNGISSVVPSDNKTVVARYAADGSQISSSVKGVNILKYSDGTTKTVIVK